MKQKSTKSVDRAFAVISSIAGVLKDAPEPSYQLKQIEERAQKMMQVYSIKVGKEHYWRISNEVQAIWSELSAEQSNIIQSSSMNVLAETLCHLIHKNTFDQLLVCTQPEISEGGISKEDFAKISQSVLRLNDRLNSYFKTKSCIYTLPKVKVVKPKKQKVRKKSKAQIMHEEEQYRIAQAKENRKNQLREMVQKAKERAK